VEVPSDTPVEEVQEGNFGVVHHEDPYVEDLKENFFHPFEGDPYLELETCVGAHSLGVVEEGAHLSFEVVSPPFVVGVHVVEDLP
jgi:hypothetical protein